MNVSPELYRRRYFPNELIHLKDDILLKQTDAIIVTKWDTLKPRTDICRGISAYFIKEGFKISKIYNHEGSLVYWYCDIIDTEYDSALNSYIFHDLLIDILIYPDGKVKVVDLDELGDLLLDNTIDAAFCSKALKTANALLDIIYNHHFKEFQKVIEELE
ncbi:MAG: DUF402 domain-containing protein [Acetivibrio sp.]